MGKPFKIILAAGAVVVLLLITAVCILPFIIDLNDFKPEIAAAVKDKTGLEPVLDGDLKLSIFPWLGISTGKIALGNAPGFQNSPFLSLDEIHVKVLLLPLLSKKVEVSRIVVKGLVVNLERNKQGIANWGDLTPPQSALVAFAIGGIAIENARINWDNFETEQHLEIKDLNLNTDKIAFDKPTGIALSLNALDTQSKTILTVKLNTELSVNQQLTIFTLRHSNAEAKESGNSLAAALTVEDVTVDINQQIAKINGLQLKSGDIMLSAELTGTQLKDNPSFQGPVSIAQFSPAKVMRQLETPVPAMQDTNALSKLSINFDLAGTADSTDLQNLDILLDDAHITGAVGIAYRDVGKGRELGAVSFKDLVSPTLSFNLNIDALDVDHYLPPAKQPSKIIVSPTALLAGGFSALPVAALKKLNAEGVVSLGKLKANGLQMQDIHSNLKAKNGIITSQQSAKQFYQGNYTGSFRMDTLSDKPTLAINEKIDRVQIEPLLKDYLGEARMSGIVDLSAQLQAQGNNADELKTSLNGQLSFLCKDSIVKGFNLQKIIDKGKALFKEPMLPKDYKNEQTLFSDISGTATIANGLIQNNDLIAKSSKLRVDGKGSIDLNTQILDYQLDAKLADAEAAAGPAQVTINVAGTFDKPTYSIDMASLLTDKNKAKINKLINKLDKKLNSSLDSLLKGLLK